MHALRTMSSGLTEAGVVAAVDGEYHTLVRMCSLRGDPMHGDPTGGDGGKRRHHWKNSTKKRIVKVRRSIITIRTRMSSH
jgi:hypothetical protein